MNIHPRDPDPDDVADFINSLAVGSADPSRFGDQHAADADRTLFKAEGVFLLARVEEARGSEAFEAAIARLDPLALRRIAMTAIRAWRRSDLAHQGEEPREPGSG